MMRRFLAPIGFAALVFVLAVQADESTPPVKKATGRDAPGEIKGDPRVLIDDTATRQVQLKRAFESFRQRLSIMAGRLESGTDKDKEKAKGLRKALKMASELGTEAKFDALIRELTRKGADQSIDILRQSLRDNAELRQDLQKLITLLSKDDAQSNKEQMDKHARLLEQLKELIARQERVRAQTDMGRKTHKELEKDQNKVTKDTRSAIDGKKGSEKEGKPGEEARGVFKPDSKPGIDGRGEARNDTGPKAEGKPSAEGKDGEGKEGKEGKSGEGKEGKEGKPGEGKSGEGKEGKEGKSGEGKPGEGKEGKSGEGKEGKGGDSKEGKSGEGKPGEGKEGKAGEGKSGEGKEGKSGEGKPGEGKEGKSGEGKDGKGGEGKEGKSGEGKPSDGKSGEGKPGQGKEGKAGGQGKEGKAGEGKPTGKEGKPGDGKSGEGKAGEGKPSEGKPGEGKSGEGKPAGSKGDGKGGEGKPQSGKPGEGKPQAGSKGQGQGKGEAKPGKPSEGKPGASGEGKPGQGKPSESKGGEGKPQSGKPGQGKEGKPGQGGQSGGDDQQPQEDNPVKKQIEDANKYQKQAEIDLDKKKSEDASENMTKAIKELENAKKKLEELLKQMREEEIERLLADLEKRCRYMLALQIEVRDGTVVLDREIEKNADRKATLLQSARSNKLADKEDEIVREAHAALKLIKTEGSAVAFAEVFEQVSKDMEVVRGRLTRVDVAAVTQQVENDIIETLKEMIAALQKAQKEMKQQQGKPQPGKSGGPQDQKLIDQIAELKMIYAMQKRVNNRTELYGKQYKGEQAPLPEEAGTPREREHLEMIQRELRDLSVRQDKIGKVTRDIATGKNEAK
ncbi:MAG: hypothetical protein U0840_16415 [Gemmataceae bacterium]